MATTIKSPLMSSKDALVLLKEVKKAIKVCDQTMELEYVTPELMEFHLDAWDARFALRQAEDECYIVFSRRYAEITLQMVQNNIANRETGVFLAMGLEDGSVGDILNSFLAMSILAKYFAWLDAWKEQFAQRRQNA